MRLRDLCSFAMGDACTRHTIPLTSYYQFSFVPFLPHLYFRTRRRGANEGAPTAYEPTQTLFINLHNMQIPHIPHALFVYTRTDWLTSWDVEAPQLLLSSNSSSTAAFGNPCVLLNRRLRAARFRLEAFALVPSALSGSLGPEVRSSIG